MITDKEEWELLDVQVRLVVEFNLNLVNFCYIFINGLGIVLFLEGIKMFNIVLFFIIYREKCIQGKYNRNGGIRKKELFG